MFDDEKIDLDLLNYLIHVVDAFFDDVRLLLCDFDLYLEAYLDND